jgi:hypothetical protein
MLPLYMAYLRSLLLLHLLLVTYLLFMNNHFGWFQKSAQAGPLSVSLRSGVPGVASEAKQLQMRGLSFSYLCDLLRLLYVRFYNKGYRNFR